MPKCLVVCYVSSALVGSKNTDFENFFFCHSLQKKCKMLTLKKENVFKGQLQIWWGGKGRQFWAFSRAIKDFNPKAYSGFSPGGGASFILARSAKIF